MSTSVPKRFEIAAWCEAEHLEGAVALSRAVGWPHRREDWLFAARLGEGTVALEAGRVVGTAFRWRYGGGQARVGSVIVDPALQRAGLGGRLMEACLAGLEDETVILNATAAGLALYRRLGFDEIGRFEQWQGVVEPGAIAGPPKADLPTVGAVRPARASDLAAIGTFDREAIGADRAAVLAALHDIGETSVVEVGGRIAGFAVCRPFGHGNLIGPLVARNHMAAEALLEAAVEQYAGAFVRMDTPANGGLGPRLQALGLAKVDTVVGMAKGLPLPTAGMRTFALASQALG